MKKILIAIGGVILVVLLVGIYQYNFTDDDVLVKEGGDVTWEQAIVILNSGNVETIMQTHSLDVGLYLKDGTSFNTKEPRIDMIFDEVEKCGKVCKDIILATE